MREPTAREKAQQFAAKIPKPKISQNLNQNQQKQVNNNIGNNNARAASAGRELLSQNSQKRSILDQNNSNNINNTNNSFNDQDLDQIEKKLQQLEGRHEQDVMTALSAMQSVGIGYEEYRASSKVGDRQSYNISSNLNSNNLNKGNNSQQQLPRKGSIGNISNPLQSKPQQQQQGKSSNANQQQHQKPGSAQRELTDEEIFRNFQIAEQYEKLMRDGKK
ncbi:MAG: hypothetical protein EZS28_037230 [Streblomastix strix]|uniref:Uncharacterized protein n=1 Tax=Streblomastix strix TaxID=222440 RepID=A0A5J4UBJ1_9EUKA|nr:MAG: hypothetical protein EZS28_037230 [Streblomastix strix]